MLLLIVNNAVLGIVTSLFLKKLNSILKAFASAIELVLTAVLSVPLLGKREVCYSCSISLLTGIPLTLHTVVALKLISVAVVMYAQNPVQSHTQKEEKSQNISKV